VRIASSITTRACAVDTCACDCSAAHRSIGLHGVTCDQHRIGPPLDQLVDSQSEPALVSGKASALLGKLIDQLRAGRNTVIRADRDIHSSTTLAW